MPITWILVGIVASDPRKGAQFAGAWGLIAVFFILLNLLGKAASRFSSLTYGGAATGIVGLLSFPVALLAWGTHSAHGWGVLWIILGFIIAGYCLRGLVWVHNKLDERTDLY